jgi:hypothetical protein
MAVSNQLHSLAALSQWREAPGIYWTGSWLCSGDGLTAVAERMKVPAPTWHRIQIDQPVIANGCYILKE